MPNKYEPLTKKEKIKLDDEDVELFSDLVNEIKEPGMK